MIHKLNDFKETFLHCNIHQVLMKSWKGRNANAGSGNRKWDRLMETQRTGVGWGGYYHRCDEWGWWQQPWGDHSVTQTGFCAPNFIIMTQSHQQTPSDKSRAEFSQKDQLNWLGFSGLSQMERMAWFHSDFRCLSRLSVHGKTDALYVIVFWFWKTPELMILSSN